eukprot:7862808-Pyramimonas_sp.AAC.1
MSDTSSGYPRYYCCASDDACLHSECPRGAGDDRGALQAPGPALQRTLWAHRSVHMNICT